MASSMNFVFVLFFACSLFLIQGTLGEVICETLPTNLCSFAIATSGKRCVLENFQNDAGKMEYTCKTSEVIVSKMAGYIETDKCVQACGVDRSFLGISSDPFFMTEFAGSLCSSSCQENCPNIVDLYFNLAAAEGVHLPSLCKKQKLSPHRAMTEFLSSGGVVVAPASSPDAPAHPPF